MHLDAHVRGAIARIEKADEEVVSGARLDRSCQVWFRELTSESRLPVERGDIDPRRVLQPSVQHCDVACVELAVEIDVPSRLALNRGGERRGRLRGNLAQQ